jgi:hypothetical protein
MSSLNNVECKNIYNIFQIDRSSIMRNYFSCILITSFLFGSFSTLSAQELKKENIAVLQFSGWQGRDVQIYQDALTDKISTLIIESQRFNVIDRRNIDKIMREQGLQMSGIIDENTAVEFGKIIGVQKMLIGSFTKNATDYHKGKYKEFDEKKGKEVKVASFYYSANVSVSIQMIDVETGKYIEAAEANGKGKGTNENSAFSRALDDVATNVVAKFFKYFAIHGFIESMDKSKVIIDRGASEGIKRLMNFEILEISKDDLLKLGKLIISPNTKRIGLLKIVTAERNSAEGRLIGDYSAVRAGSLIREVKEEAEIEASIIEKNGGNVVIDMGKNVGLVKGATFDVLRTGDQYIDRVTGESFGIEKMKIGKVYISQVGPRFSRGKILEGRYSIKENMVLRETNPWKSNYLVRVSYGINNVDVNMNTTPWKGEIKNQYVDSKLDSVEYQNLQKVDSGSMIKLQFGKWNEVKGLEFLLGVGILKISDELSAFTVDFSITKHFGIIPELFYCYAGAGIGFGNAQQNIKPEIISYLSKNNRDNVTSAQGQWEGLVGFRFVFGNINVYGEVNYLGLTFNKWNYSVKYEDTNEREKIDTIQIDNQLVPYPKLSVSGPVVRIGLAYNIKGLTRLFWIF